MIKQINLSNFITPFGYIYCHKNTINNKRYIGANISRKSSRNFFLNGKRRTLKAFLNAYKNNPYFVNALKKYGVDIFETKLLDFTVDLKDTDIKEAFYIQKYNTLNRNYGYNLMSGGRNGIPSKEVREKMSKTRKGKKHSKETKLKISEAHRGKKLSEEHKRKLSESHKGQLPNSGSFKKGHISWIKGKKMSEETKRKVSEAKKNPSKETRRKMSESQKGIRLGIKLSEEHKRKLSEAKKGEKYYCLECKIYHYYSSIKGKTHLKFEKKVI